MSETPRFTSWLLSRALSPTDRRYVLSDLAEEYAELLRTKGRRAARRWYRSQVIRSLIPSLRRRQTLLRNGRSSRRQPQRGAKLLDSIRHDLRFALRGFRRSPGFTAVVVITLALGIGANTAAFSLVNSVLLNPVSLEGGGRIVQLWRDMEVPGHMVSTSPTREMIDAWRRRSTVFEVVAEYQDADFLYLGSGEPMALRGTFMSPDMMALLEVSPSVGRTFSEEDGRAGSDRVVLLTEGFWQRQFASDATVMGRTIVLDADPYVIVGVVPGGTADLFERVFLGEEPQDLWALMPTLLGSEVSENPYAVGRMRPGVALAEANEELSRIQEQLIAEGIVDEGWMASASAPQELVSQDLQTGLWVLYATVGLVLLIACANIANMLLARGVVRGREFAIRAALGAGWVRVGRQLLTESLLFSLLGAAIGVLLARWSLDVVAGLYEGDLVRLRGVELEPLALVYTLGLAFLVGILFTLAATIQLRSLGVARFLARGSEAVWVGARRFLARQALVSLEVALALLLFLGAGLVVNSFLRLQQVDPGFDSENLVAIRVSLPEERYPEAPSQVAFFEDVASRMRQLGGVESVALGRGVPPRLSALFGTIEVEGHEVPDDNPTLVMTGNFVSPEYFSTIRAPIRSGRPLLEQDTDAGKVSVVVNEAFARRYFPEEEAVGNRVLFQSGVPSYSPDGWRTIVGVTADVKAFSLEDDPDRLQLYFPFSERSPSYGVFIVRAADDPSALIPLLKEQVWSVDSSLPIEDVRRVEEIFAGTITQQRFNAILLTGFAILALVLAVVGVYGVVSLAVSQRTHEIGVRVALGADRADILKMVVTSGFKAILIGVVTGLGLALALTRFLQGLLFEVQPTDPLTYAIVIVVLSSVGLVACYLPSRRATVVDPMEALRHE